MNITLAQAKRITGTWPCAVFLYCLPSYIAEAKTSPDGHKWACMLKSEWMAELQFTRHEYNTAIARLKQLDLLIIKRQPFKDHARAFIRLNEARLEEALKTKQTDLKSKIDGNKR